MSNKLRIRRRSATGVAGAPSSLLGSELAFNEKDFTLYYGYGDDGSGNATSIISIGGKGSFVDRSTDQSVDGIKTFTASPVVPNLVVGDNSTKAVNSKFVKDQGYITGNQTITISGDATGSGTTSIPITFATVNANVGTFTKVTVNAKGLVTAATTLSAADIPTLTAAKISDFDNQVRTSRLDQMAVPTAAVSYNNQKITNLAAGSLSSDGVNKGQLDALMNYVDAVKSNQDRKESVRLTSTDPADSLSGLGARDGVTPNPNDRIAIITHNDNTKLGIYLASSGTWARSLDADSNAEFTSGLTFFIEEGNTLAGREYTLTTPNPITLGTTALTFVYSGAGTTYSAGLGIGLSGTTFFVDAGTGLVQTADGLAISSSYAGQTSITTLGTITTGTWQGTKVALAYGGTNTDLTAFADNSVLVKSGSSIIAATDGVQILTPNSIIDCGTF